MIWRKVITYCRFRSCAAFCILQLRKHAYAICRDSFFSSLKIENFNKNNYDIFSIFAQNIDCVYTLEPPCRDGFNEYPQSMFWSKNKKALLYKIGYKEVYI